MNEQQHLIKIGKTTNKKKSLPFELLVEISEEANILFSNKLQICLEKRLTKEQLQLEKYWYSKAKNLLISSTLINLLAGRIFRRTRLIYLKKRQIMDPQNIVNKINSSLENNTEFINELGSFKHDVDHRLNQLRKQTNDNFNLLASENNKRIIDLQREMMEKIETLKSETNANFDSYESYNGRAYASFAVRIGHNNSELIELKNMLGEYLRGNRKRQYEEQQQSSSFGLKKRKKISSKDIDTGESNSGRSDSSDQSSNNSMESIEEYQNNFGTNHPCIIPLKDFNSKYIAETLNNLMKEDLPNKMEILKNIIICDNAQRQDIKCSFKENYGLELIDQMKTVFDDYHFLITALMETPAYYDVLQIRRAVEGAGKLDLILIEIMTTRTNSQILSIRSIYSKLFGKDLELDILGEDPGYYLRLLTSLTKGNRNESKITDPVKAHEDVSLLCHAIDSRFGAYEQKFISFLATESYDQLRLTFNEYNQTFQKCPLDIAIIEKFSGDIRIGLLTFVKSISNRKVFLSELIYNSIYSYETNKDFDLVRIIVTRSEIDLADIRVIYKKIYGKKLEQAISEQCLWSYKDCLMSIVKGFKQ